MRYEVGDKVRVRNDLVIGKDDGDFIFNSEMEKYKGKILTISKYYEGWY